MACEYLTSVRRRRIPGVGQRGGTRSFSARSCSWNVVSIKEHLLKERTVGG